MSLPRTPAPAQACASVTPKRFARLFRSIEIGSTISLFECWGTREEAEDIAQEVFITVFKSIDSFRGDSKFSTLALSRGCKPLQESN